MDVPCANPIAQTMQKVVEVPQVRFHDRVADDPAGTQVPVTLERIVEVTDVLVPRVMEETVEVGRLTFQLPGGESTLLTDNELSSQLDGSCAAQAPQWEELRRLGDEELVTIRDTNKLLNDSDEFISKWFNVVKGVVDSEGVPLNVYRETLLRNKILRVIKKNYVTKYLEILAEIAELNVAYKKFYEQFGERLKLGNDEDSTVGVKTAEVLRFNTSKPGGEHSSFEEYVDRMKEGQNDIFYITGENIAVVSSSPFVENLRKKGLEAHYVVDPVDEHTVQQVREFDGKMLKSTTKEGLDLGDEDEKKTLEELKAEFEPLTELMKEVLGDKVEEAIVDDGTVDSLRVLTTSGHGVSANMERIMKAQVPLDSSTDLAFR